MLAAVLPASTDVYWSIHDGATEPSVLLRSGPEEYPGIGPGSP